MGIVLGREREHHEQWTSSWFQIDRLLLLWIVEALDEVEEYGIKFFQLNLHSFLNNITNGGTRRRQVAEEGGRKGSKSGGHACAVSLLLKNAES